MNPQWINRIRWILVLGLVVGCAAVTQDRAMGANEGEFARHGTQADE